MWAFSMDFMTNMISLSIILSSKKTKTRIGRKYLMIFIEFITFSNLSKKATTKMKLKEVQNKVGKTTNIHSRDRTHKE